MNKQIRAISLMLSVIMLFSAAAITAYAETGATDPTSTDTATQPTATTTATQPTTTAAQTTTAKKSTNTPASAVKTSVKKKTEIKKISKKKPKKPKPTEIKSLIPQKNGFKIKWKKVKKIKGYHLQWSITKKFKKAKKYTKKVFLKSKVISGNIVRLGAKKKYYFRIRTYKMKGKKKVFSKWSKVICKKTL